MSSQKTALIVGSKTPIGTAVAKRLEEDAFAVCGVDIDVCDVDAVDAALAQAMEGDGCLDAVVYCATSDARVPLAKAGSFAWDDLRKANMDGLFLVMQHAARIMVEAGGGRIVAVLADDAVGEDPTSPLHAASMWGARGLVRNFAQTLARKGVSVNAVCPMTESSGAAPLTTVPSCGDVAIFVSFLLGEANHVTGQAVPLAAGRSLL